MYFYVIFRSRKGIMRPFGVQSYKKYLKPQSIRASYFI